jgi:hypothetical protein
MSKSSRPPLLRESLEPWCAAGVTGALRVLDPPGGVVYVVDGRIAYAETPVASGVERLLTASGRLPADAWRAAVTAGRAQHRIGPELVDAGLVTQTELEALGVIALYDAAFFLFDLVVSAHFEHRARHPVGHLRTLDLRSVCQEVDRRKRLLADAWPDAAIDTAAVLPQRRLRSQCVALTALQWEVVANADRRRSPIDLARLLGRDTFTVMLEVRRPNPAPRCARKPPPTWPRPRCPSCSRHDTRGPNPNPSVLPIRLPRRLHTSRCRGEHCATRPLRAPNSPACRTPVCPSRSSPDSSRGWVRCDARPSEIGPTR